MSPKWITRACGLGHWGPSDQGLGRVRKKSAGTCRVVMKKTEWGTPANFALITEGASYEGRKLPATAWCRCMYLCLNSISTYL
jgi:hypothetical protein